MATKIQFPKDKSKQAEVVRRMMIRGQEPCNRKMVDWWVSHFYLQGVRDFSNADWKTGHVRMNFGRQDAQGYNKTFRYEEVTSKYQMELGRLLKIDLTPRVLRRGEGLDSLRKASVGQLVLDDLVPPEEAIRLKKLILPLQLQFGTVGLVAWRDPHGRPRIEVFPPWEARPVPGDAIANVDLQGLMRVRKVSVDWLKTRKMGTTATTALNSPELETEDVPIGAQAVDSINHPMGQGGSSGVTLKQKSGASSGQAGKKSTGPLTHKVTTLCELWLEAEGGRLGVYVIWAGGKVLVSVDHQESRNPPPMPVAMAHYLDVGSFYGRSFVSPLIPLNAEVEGLLSRLFTNLQELDLMGILLVPTTLGVQLAQLRASGRPKVLLYEPDYTSPETKIDRIGPVNTGAGPARIVEHALKLMDRLAQQSPMLTGDAPGRSCYINVEGRYLDNRTNRVFYTNPVMEHEYEKKHRSLRR